jgi:hypothetical protein
MLVLNATNKTIKVSMAAPAATTNPGFAAAWADNNSTSFIEGASDGALNGISDVTVIAAPAASTRRIVKKIMIENCDTAAVTITVKYDNNGTQRILAKTTLAVGDTWSFEGVYDGNGNFKTAVSNTATAIVVGSTTISGGSTGQILYDNAGTLGELATTGSGNVVRATSPTLVTPILGTPFSGTLTNCSGLPLTTGVTGILTGANGGTGVNNGSSTITIGGNVTYSGAHTFTGTLTGNTSVTFPTSGTLATTAGTVESFSAGTTGFTPNTATTGAVTLAGTLGLANGGTNANLTASNGGIVYSGASAFAVLSGTATAGQILRSGSSAAPSWSTATYPSTATGTGKLLRADGTNWAASTATYPDTATGTGTILRADGTNWVATTATYPTTTTANQLLYSSATNTVGELTSANTSALVTNSTGVPSFTSGTTANRVLTTNGTTVSFTQILQAMLQNGTSSVPGVVGTGPAFSAPSGTAVGTTSSTWTQMKFGSASFDTGSGYNSATWTYTPPVNGYYLVVAACNYSNTDAATQYMSIAIYKDGVSFQQGALIPALQFAIATVSAVMSLTTTNAITIYGIQNNATPSNMAGISFAAVLLRAA